jgi:predicted glycosyltransferase
MRIWIDLGNSPHVPFFKVLAEEFEKRGHRVLWTARDYAQTVELARKAGLDPEVFGTHGGRSIRQKGIKFGSRTIQLLNWTRGKKIDLAVSHNSHEPLAVAKIRRIKSVNLMDYEHHPANKLSFRLADRIIVPKLFPDEFLEKFGAFEKTAKYEGIKEDVYLSDFNPSKDFQKELNTLGISPADILVVVRPHAPEALYHRKFSNEMLDKILDEFASAEKVKIILLPRKKYQGEDLRQKHPEPNIIIPDKVLDGANLLASADLVISGGGTMNREAAALGIPTATIFAGQWAAVDEYLLQKNLMQKIETFEDLAKIKPKKKSIVNRRKYSDVKNKITDLILGVRV